MTGDELDIYMSHLEQLYMSHLEQICRLLQTEAHLDTMQREAYLDTMTKQESVEKLAKFIDIKLFAKQAATIRMLEKKNAELEARLKHIEDGYTPINKTDEEVILAQAEKDIDNGLGVEDAEMEEWLEKEDKQVDAKI